MLSRTCMHVGHNPCALIDARNLFWSGSVRQAFDVRGFIQMKNKKKQITHSKFFFSYRCCCRLRCLYPDCGLVWTEKRLQFSLVACQWNEMVDRLVLQCFRDVRQLFWKWNIRWLILSQYVKPHGQAVCTLVHNILSGKHEMQQANI